jgi:peptidoglycan/LPS O-acetylase OafA/YrhL
MALVGGLGFLACWWYFQNQVDIFSGIATTTNAALFYPAISIACTALTGAFIRYGESPGGRVARMVYLTSLTSYSLYLLHLQIFVYLSPRAESPGSAWLWFAVALSAMILAGSVLYVLVEKPFMKLRRRFDPADTVSTHLQAQPP